MTISYILNPNLCPVEPLHIRVDDKGFTIAEGRVPRTPRSACVLIPNCFSTSTSGGSLKSKTQRKVPVDDQSLSGIYHCRRLRKRYAHPISSRAGRKSPSPA